MHLSAILSFLTVLSTSAFALPYPIHRRTLDPVLFGRHEGHDETPAKSGNQPNDVMLGNGKLAQERNLEFQSLKATDPCDAGAKGCIDGQLADCRSNEWTTRSCGTQMICAALPYLDGKFEGTYVTCAPETTALETLKKSGVIGGLTGRDGTEDEADIPTDGDKDVPSDNGDPEEDGDDDAPSPGGCKPGNGFDEPVEACPIAEPNPDGDGNPGPIVTIPPPGATTSRATGTTPASTPPATAPPVTSTPAPDPTDEPIDEPAPTEGPEYKVTVTRTVTKVVTVTEDAPLPTDDRNPTPSPTPRPTSPPGPNPRPNPDNGGGQDDGAQHTDPGAPNFVPSPIIVTPTFANDPAKQTPAPKPSGNPITEFPPDFTTTLNRDEASRLLESLTRDPNNVIETPPPTPVPTQA